MTKEVGASGLSLLLTGILMVLVFTTQCGVIRHAQREREREMEAARSQPQNIKVIDEVAEDTGGIEISY